MANKADRVVFIGNIPYGLTEEEIMHIFSSAGQILTFHLVYDNDTGRPKGFGFAEFLDADSAASAVRNLNNHQVMGRELRVDFANAENKGNTASAGNNAQQQQQFQPPNGYQPPPVAGVGGLPPLPPGVDLPPNVTCPDAISKTLSTLPSTQLMDIITQMKGLVMTDPAKATELLKQAPQLSYAIFQALLLMGLVDTSVLGSVVEQAQQPVQPPPQPVPARPTPVYQAPPPQPYPQYPPQMPPQMHVPTPPVQHQPYQPPPVQQQQQPPPPQSQAMNQEELLKQVMAMTQQQIDQLPPADRAQIMLLRQNLQQRAY